MQVKSLWLLFNSPFEADEVRRVLEHSGSLKLLGIKQTSTTSQPSKKPPHNFRPKQQSLHEKHQCDIQEALGTLMGMAVPALYAGPSARGMICIVSDRLTGNNLIRTMNATLPPGTSALVLVSPNVTATKRVATESADSGITSEQALSRDEFQDLIKDAFIKLRAAKAG
jgi:uncharacterized membrane protein